MEGRPKKLPVIFYRTPAGTEPVREWLNGLPQEDRRILGHDIGTVEFGWPVGMPLCRSLGGGLWEVRSNLMRGRIARVIFCTAQGRMILLHGFVKKTQKTPQPDLELARKRQKGDRAMSDNPRFGSSFDDWLQEQGIYEEVKTQAVKRVLAWQIEQAMKAQGISKVEMARRMGTSRAHLDRLLDPDNDKVQLDTVQRAAAAVGRKLRLELA